MSKPEPKQLEAPRVNYDDTDHFTFSCPDCGCDLNIEKANTSHDGKQNCTRFYLRCPICRGEAYRKIYWGEAGKITNGQLTHMGERQVRPPFNPETDMPGS